MNISLYKNICGTYSEKNRMGKPSKYILKISSALNEIIGEFSQNYTIKI